MKEETYKELLKKTNLIFALADIQEGLAKDLESHAIRLNSFKYDVKKQIIAMQKNSEKFRGMATNILKEKGQEEIFGIDSDYLKDIIFKELGIK
ncbi:MAG: hypothetical protein ACK5KP_11195 [Paludibacteraceae bacterium]